MVQYHVTLNGQGYVLDLDRYQKRIRDPFPSKQAAGSVDFGDLRGPEQLLVISDWSGGEGAVQHDEAAPSRYRSGTDLDIWSQPGGLRLGPETGGVGGLTNFGVDESCALGVFNGQLMIGLSNGQIYRWDGSAYTALINTGLPLRCFEVFQNRLHYACSGTGQVGSYTTTWVNTPNQFTAAGSGGIFWMATHYRQAAQYLYAFSAANGAGATSRAYYWDGGALSAGQFDFEELYVLSSAVLGGRLYMVACDLGNTARLGLYSVDNSGSGGLWVKHGAIQGVTCWSMVAFDGALYLGLSPGGQVVKWDGSTFTRVLQLGTTLAPHSGDIRGMAVWQGALWIATADASGIFFMRYDGEVWSRPVYALGGIAPRAATVYGDQLVVGTYRTTVGAQGTAWRTNTGVRTSGTLESGLISCGLPGVSKLFKSVTLVTSALATGQSVAVQYRLEDTGGWTTLGTLSGGSSTTATYQFAANTTGRLLSVRLVLTTSSAGNGSPVVQEVSLRYVPRPTLAREWDLAVLLEGTAELPMVTLDQAPEPLTGAQLSAALWTAAGVAGTVTLVDLDGVSYSVYVQDVKEEVGKISQRRGYQRLGLVKLVEAA